MDWSGTRNRGRTRKVAWLSWIATDSPDMVTLPTPHCLGSTPGVDRQRERNYRLVGARHTKQLWRAG